MVDGTQHATLDTTDLHKAGYISATEPADLRDGIFWIDTSTDPPILRYYSESAADWVAVGTVANLADLGDVNFTSIADKEIIYWDDANSEFVNALLTDANVATANKDGVAATPSLRTLGTSSTQAAAGDHEHAGGTRALFSFTFGNGADAIDSSTEPDQWVEVPFDCEIVEVRVGADISGSIVFDVWKDTYTNFPPTVADTITASAKPTLSTEIKSEDTALTGWTTSLSQGDWLKVHVDSASTIKRAVLSISVDKV